jgi:hypothetical protein
MSGDGYTWTTRSRRALEKWNGTVDLRISSTFTHGSYIRYRSFWALRGAIKPASTGICWYRYWRLCFHHMYMLMYIYMHVIRAHTYISTCSVECAQDSEK